MILHTCDSAEEIKEAVQKAKMIKASHDASRIANHAYLAAKKAEIDAFASYGFADKATKALYNAQKVAEYASEDAERFAGTFFFFFFF